jgi:hypothetical protein
MSKIRSTAAHVLSTGEATDEEAKSLAAYALGDAAPVRTTRTKQDLESMIAKLSDVEGQAERVAMMRAELAKLA